MTRRQSYLEASFPSSYLVPSTSTSDEKKLDRKDKKHDVLESKLSISNTIFKFILDQTVGAAVNTLLFSLVFAGFNGAGYAEAIQVAGEEFWPLIYAGWKLWPMVSVTNYAFVKSVEGRTLVGSLAGMGWGVYMSLMRS
jgi:protein Mpv17